MLIEDLEAIPEQLLVAMEQLRPLLLRETYTSDIRYTPEVVPILDMLDKHLKTCSITAFHCSREPESGYFAAEGLRKLDLQHYQDWFIECHGAKFSDAQLLHIKFAWRSYFDRNQVSGREAMLWFCLMPELVADGCENFFRYFGGEAIYMAVSEPSVKEQLENIGHPVVVEICIPGKDVITCQRLALGTLNAFHRRINPAAPFCGVEGYLRRNIGAKEVVKVWKKNDFFAHHHLPI